jgi:tetratricopeptide (TPR) repeat protein
MPQDRRRSRAAAGHMGRFSQAIDPLTEALRLDPLYRNARYLLSDAYMRSGRYQEAIDSWTKFLELVPDRCHDQGDTVGQVLHGSVQRWANIHS